MKVKLNDLVWKILISCTPNDAYNYHDLSKCISRAISMLAERIPSLTIGNFHHQLEEIAKRYLSESHSGPFYAADYVLAISKMYTFFMKSDTAINTEIPLCIHDGFEVPASTITIIKELIDTSCEQLETKGVTRFDEQEKQRLFNECLWWYGNNMLEGCKKEEFQIAAIRQRLADRAFFITDGYNETSS